MMRPLRVSIAIAMLSLLQLVACEDGARRTKAAVARSRDSSLAHDLEIAGARETTAVASDGRDTRAVTQSPGMLDSSQVGPRAATDSAETRNVSDVAPSSTASSPSAEGYIGPSCASPARDDQQRCLLGYLERSDAELDRNYQALINQLKSEAGTRASASEPPSVARLRTAQRSWLVYRDDECRKRTKAREGPLWAPVRAECLAQYSAMRSRELEDALAKRKTIAAKSDSSKPKATIGTKSTSRTKASKSRRRRAR